MSRATRGVDTTLPHIDKVEYIATEKVAIFWGQQRSRIISPKSSFNHNYVSKVRASNWKAE
ncbi:uncharacterized protein BDCG_16945 [Blastomyces dermatitidis ER-3]|uniref:Uncharacterized protein n=1 Tax=Ajellomyces dermatitidis (strain ER-3 / ATCC MYA-2586) TaxID=559297 RepID=A0ABX2VWP6_AJEDR|nr:uncharacterized protein BDCG_16945 [Blastomyces dermatitidis ER-3]OAT01173.1 hypothetical protein BDCG_16945 [Blastomyces dermatitidis ER-3]